MRCSLLSVAVLAFSCAHVPPSPDAQRIVSLTIEGTSAIPEAEVKRRIVTGSSTVFASQWFDASTWQADVRRVVRLYEAEGYYQARISDERIEEVTSNAVRLVLKVSEGAPTRIGTFTIAGLETVDGAVSNRVTLGLPLAIGDIFRERAWAETKTLLVARLKETGYAEALVAGEAVVDPDGATATLVMTCQPGARLKFGKLIPAPEPNAQVPNELLRDVVGLEVVAGDWYSESALARAQQRLFAMGVFSAVKVTRLASDRDEGTVPVQIDVREAPFRSIRLGGGVGGDLVRQEVRGIVEFTHRNVGFSRLISKGSRLDRFTLKAKAGWAFLASQASATRGLPNGPLFRLLAEYEVPRVGGFRTLSLQTSLDVSRTVDVAFDAWGAEYEIGLVWRPSTELSITPLAFNGSLYALSSVVPTLSTTPTAALGCPRLPALCLIGALETKLEWDRRDDRLDPTRGTYFSLSAQGGLAQTGSLTPYLKVTADARAYIGFGPDKRFVLAGKLAAGTIFSTTTNTPIVARFFSGGSQMRGFYQRRLSPLVVYGSDKSLQDFVNESKADPSRSSFSEEQHQAAARTRAQDCRVTNAEDCRDFSRGAAVPIGGNGLLEASMEFRWNVWGPLLLAVFADAGLVTTAPLGAGTSLSESLFVGVGAGFRYRSPIGPIRVDIAYRLPFVGGPLSATQGDVRAASVRGDRGCFFAVDGTQHAGAPDNLCALHLTVGEAF